MATAMIKHLIDQRARAWDEEKALLDAVEAQQRDLNAEEQEKCERLDRDIDEFGARIKDLEALEERKKNHDEQRAHFEVAVKTEASPVSPQEQLNDKIRQFMRGGLPGAEYAPRSVEFKIRHEDKMPLMDAAGGHSNFMEKREQRDLSKLSAGAGGNVVPTGFISRLYEHMVEVSSVRQSGAIVFTTDSGENLLVPKTTTHGAAALVAEAAAIAESDPVFGQQTLNAYKYGVLIEVSNELITDSGIDLLGYLARASGRALGLASGVHFVTGTGTAQPEGIMTNMVTGKVGAVGQTLTVIGDDLIDLYHSVVSGYRQNGTWMMRDASLAIVRKIKDSSGGAGIGNYLWQPGLTAGAPDRLLGRPVLTDPTIAAMAANADSIAFGDFSEYYAIRDVSGVRFERSDDFRFANDLVAFRALVRTDGKPMDLTAAKCYTNSAT